MPAGTVWGEETEPVTGSENTADVPEETAAETLPAGTAQAPAAAESSPGTGEGNAPQSLETTGGASAADEIAGTESVLTAEPETERAGTGEAAAGEELTTEGGTEFEENSTQESGTEETDEESAQAKNGTLSENHDDAVTVRAAYTADSIDASAVITEAVWGEPAIRIDKDSNNTSLYSYNGGTAEDTYADLYFLWDHTYLYIGMVSPDSDVAGNDDSWAGDGIQFNLMFNTVTQGVYFTFGADGVTLTQGDAIANYAKNLSYNNGNIYASIAVPFADLGLASADIANGTSIGINLLRVSGTSDVSYAGWLAWGAFFGEGNEYNPDCYAANVIVLSDEMMDNRTVADALYAPSGLDASSPLTEAVWGSPSIRIDKSSNNTSLYNYNGTAEDTYADLYFRWDRQNLYIGMASPDTAIYGHSDAWAGDGIQFNLIYGTTTLGVYFTFGEDGVTLTQGDAIASYAKNLSAKDGILYASIAVPFSDIGLASADLVSGTEIGINLLRISGTADAAYAGWLAWGAFFGENHEYNPGCYVTNAIRLSGETIDNGTAVKAPYIPSGLDVTQDITEKMWGMSAIRIDKNSNNTSLYNYEGGVAEDTWADLYFAWDREYLYIGMASPDSAVYGHSDAWAGDGIQFNLMYDTTTLGVYFTFDADGVSLTQGDAIRSYAKNLSDTDGILYASIAVPVKDIGLAPADLQEGTQIDINLLRISGTADKAYAGWLAWGAFFGANAEYNPACYAVNTIILSEDVLDNGTAVKATKLTEKLDASRQLKAKNWGEPTIRINRDSNNTALTNYNGGTAEDTYADLYFRWDDEKLYIGMVSPDEDIAGHHDAWAGDGIQMNLIYGTTTTGVYFTFDEDGVSLTQGDAIKEYDKSLTSADGLLYASIAVPFTDMGLAQADITDGTEIQVNLLRISGTTGYPYAGWLSWGAFFGVGHEYNEGCYTTNVIILSDENADQKKDTFAGSLVNIPLQEGRPFDGDAESLTGGNRMVSTADGIYMVYQSRSKVLTSAGNPGRYMVNEFALHRLGNDTAEELWYGYVYQDDVDLAADSRGTVYVTGGTDIRTLHSMSSRYDYSSETGYAVLNVWAYDGEGTLNGYAKHIPFVNQSTEIYTYLTSSIDSSDNLLLYFASDSGSVEIFTFQTASRTWSSDVKCWNLAAPPLAQKALVSGEPVLVYSSAAGLSWASDSGDILLQAGASLLDALKEEDGSVRILYQAGDKVCEMTVRSDSILSDEETEISSGSGVSMTYVGDELITAAIRPGEAASVEIYEGTGAHRTLEDTVELDNVVEMAEGAGPMLLSPNNGSGYEDTLVLAFGGKRVNALSWYYCELEPGTEETEGVDSDGSAADGIAAVSLTADGMTGSE